MPNPSKKSRSGQRKSTSQVAPTRRPGRPAAEQDGEAVRRQLLDHAREQFAQHGYAGVSLRRLAAEVGVNPAMVHYYFGNKQGLFLTMLAEHVEPLLTRLEQTMEDSHTEGQQSLEKFLALFTDTLRRESWLPGLVLREVLPTQGALHDVVIEHYARRAGLILRALIEREQSQGKVSTQRDPAITALGLISQVWFPFLARPLAERVFGTRLNGDFTPQLVQHILAGLYSDDTLASPDCASTGVQRTRRATRPDPS